jgi:gliding motility-associated-like protein
MLDSIVTQIITNTTIEVDATASNDTICQGESVVISATGGNTYQWSNGYSSQSITVTPNTTTTYTVTGTDINGCFDIAIVPIYVNPLPQITINANPSEICIGQASTLTASGGNTYLWSTNEVDSSIVVSPLSSTTYYVTATDTNLCSNSSSFLLNVHPLPNINIIAQPDTNICIGMSAILTASGGINYNWSNGQNNSQITIQPTNSTTYFVTVVDNNGCIDSSFINIYVNPYPNVDFYADIFYGCQPLKVNFTNISDNGSSHWLFGDGGTSNISNPTHIFNQDGIFDITLIVKNEYNCADTLTKNDYIVVYPQPVANFRPIPNIVTENNGTVTINDESIDAENWYYDFGDTSTTADIFFINEPSYTYTTAGDYIITQIVSNNYNCSDTATNIVIVKSDFMLYVPNSFTPSTKNDLNDYFYIFSYGLTPEKFYIKIFNRWGQTVFSSNDPGFRWDGKCDNNLCPQGVYTYIIHYKTPDNNEHDKYGYIMLLH